MDSSTWSRVLDRVKERPVTTVVATNIATALVVGACWMRSSGLSLGQAAQLGVLSIVKAVPGGKGLIESKQQEMVDKMEEEILEVTAHEESFAAMPEHGHSREDVQAIIQRYSEFDGKMWRSGHLSGAVYHGGDDLSAIISDTYSRFSLTNPLHPDIFPMGRKMEAEVVSMAVQCFNGGPKACGCLTTGGTESILMAMKAYRERGRLEKGITAPEMVVPRTAHAAFDKACDYFCIKKVEIDVDPVTFKPSIEAYEKAITKNTVVLVGSAVSFPQGVLDPIEKIGALGQERDIPVHVDSCLGSFCIAFSEAAGFPLPPFDFRVPGVTSISADTHKYGFAPKGTSVIMYASPAYRAHQFYVNTDWCGGIYASPGVSGSRPGGLAAAAWAVMLHMGRDGYTKAARAILTAARTVTEGVRAQPGIKLMGEPELSVVCFASEDEGKLNTYAVADALKLRGWNLNLLQFPTCAHLCVTYANHANADKFVTDLKESVEEVTAHPEKFTKGSAAVYGMSTALADRSLVADLAKAFLETTYKTSK